MTAVLGSSTALSEQQLPLLPWQQRTLQLSKVVFTLLLAVLLAFLSWRIIAPEPLLLAAASKSSSNKITNNNSFNTAQYHLFGIAGEEPVAEVTEDIHAPDTSLRLELLGATKASKKEASTAIIAPKGKEGEFYRIGDVVQNNTKLAAVYENRVILDTNGKLETLKFDEEERAGINARVVQAPAVEKKQTNAGSLRGRFREVKNPSEFMSVITEEVAADPEGALNELGLETNTQGSGYRVMPGSMLMALQLQPGDIVLSVNGQALGDPQADQELLQQVNTEGSARIEVQRGNNRFVVNHSLR